MSSMNTSQLLMLAGLVIGFGGYFALVWHKHLKGRTMIINRDQRLYPTNYEQLSKADRRRLYRIHSWREAWDTSGKTLAAVSGFGVVAFVASLFL